MTPAKYPPKVAHVTTVDMSLKMLLLNQLKWIKENGYEVYGISSTGKDVHSIENAGICHIAVPLSRRISPLSDLLSLWRLYRIMKKEKFTIVHTHTPKAGLLGQWAAFFAGTKVRIHTIHGLYISDSSHPLVQKLGLWMEKLTLLHSQLNLSQNPEDIPVAIAKGLCKAKRIRLIGNGIDLTRFNSEIQTSENKNATRLNLSIPLNAPVVGIVGRFVKEKGYLDLLAAAKLILEKVPDTHFLFIGPLESEKADRLDPLLINKMGLENRVLFLGMRDDVASLYAVMDVFTLPSYREGFPRSPMEAAAMGVPAVVTDIRGSRQVVENGLTGYLVPVGVPEEIADKILKLLKNKSLRMEFGKAARKKAVEEFDEQKVFDRVLKAYEEMLST